MWIVLSILALLLHCEPNPANGQPTNVTTTALDIPTNFECEDEGFFPHPRDCKKYYWCLDSTPANLGIVAHAFTCPSGLFFNTATEACDYPANVACKQKKNTETRKKEASRPPAAPRAKPTTTEAPATAPPTTTTTTVAPATSPRITAELLAAALRINENRDQPQITTPAPGGNLDRLLELVQSLGGIDKLQSLVNNQNQGLNGRRPDLRESESLHNEGFQDVARPCTHVPNYFEPSYVTPGGRDLSRLTEPTTTEPVPLLSASNEPRSTIRHRRPQFDSPPPPPPPTPSQPATANPLFNYADPGRNNFHTQPALSPFAFSYNTPGGRVHSSPPVPLSLQNQQQPPTVPVAASSLPPRNTVINDPFFSFSYNTPGRFAQSSTQAATVTEPSVAQPVNDNRQIVRIPVRVSAGNEQNQGQQPRRQTGRARIQSTFAVAPGVLYDDLRDEDFALHHQPAPPTTRRPARRRPPQREHLRNRQEENPVSALVNLPPPNINLPVPVHPTQLQPRPLPPRPQIPPQAIPATLRPTTTVPPATIFAGFPARNSNRQFSSLIGNTQQPPQTQPNPTVPADFEDSSIFVTDFPFYDFPHTDEPTTTTTTTTTTTRAPPTEPPTTPPRRQRNQSRSRQQQPRQNVIVPAQAPTTARPTRRTTVAPVTGSSEETGPAVEMDPKGSINCGRRGVYAHPSNCGMFVVCAPSTRNSPTFRSYTHHCPAEQVFVEEVGRCRPGNKDRCEVFTS